jgi:hypothetical protein
MFDRVLGRSLKRNRDQQKESEDHEALLPSASDSDLPGGSPRRAYDERATTIAVRTALLCTAAYLGITIWFGFILNGTHFVADADDFCVNHVSEYCRLWCRKWR